MEIEDWVNNLALVNDSNFEEGATGRYSQTPKEKEKVLQKQMSSINQIATSCGLISAEEEDRW